MRILWVGPQNLPGPSRSGSVAPATIPTVQRGAQCHAERTQPTCGRRILTTEMPEGERGRSLYVLRRRSSFVSYPVQIHTLKGKVISSTEKSDTRSTVTLQIFPKILYAGEFWGKTSVKSFFPSISPPQRSIVQSGA